VWRWHRRGLGVFLQARGCDGGREWVISCCFPEPNLIEI
jgi:hypothetical protein